MRIERSGRAMREEVGQRVRRGFAVAGGIPGGVEQRMRRQPGRDPLRQVVVERVGQPEAGHLARIPPGIEQRIGPQTPGGAGQQIVPQGI